MKYTDPAMNARAATAKDQLLQWCQMKTKEYEVPEIAIVVVVAVAAVTAIAIKYRYCCCCYLSAPNVFVSNFIHNLKGSNNFY